MTERREDGADARVLSGIPRAGSALLLLLAAAPRLADPCLWRSGGRRFQGAALVMIAADRTEPHARGRRVAATSQWPPAARGTAAARTAQSAAGAPTACAAPRESDTGTCAAAASCPTAASTRLGRAATRPIAETPTKQKGGGQRLRHSERARRLSCSRSARSAASLQCMRYLARGKSGASELCISKGFRKSTDRYEP